jgi:hypothetical protein
VEWCFHGQQSERKMDAQVLTDGRGISEVQQSDMDDDGSSEGDFILAPSIAAFKVFGAE